MPQAPWYTPWTSRLHEALTGHRSDLSSYPTRSKTTRRARAASRLPGSSHLAGGRSRPTTVSDCPTRSLPPNLGASMQVRAVVVTSSGEAVKMITHKQLRRLHTGDPP